jgi:hypothetical protein
MMTEASRTCRLIVFVIALIPLGLLAGCRDATRTPPAEDRGTTPDTPSRVSADLDAATANDLDRQPVPLPDDELAEGWISLFDGQTLFGWRHDPDTPWRVEEGAIVADQPAADPLLTTTSLADYVLRLEYLRQPGTRAGIVLAAAIDSTDPTSACYEISLADPDDPFPTGSLIGREAIAQDLNRTDWQSVEVAVERGRLRIRLDDRDVLDYTDPDPLYRGHIGLRLREGRIAFRNIRLRPLGLESIFNGRDLSGWKTYPDMASRFTVTEEGYLRVQDGRGQLETERSFGDFVLQLECITHAPGLNSGIFFRCIPGELMNGYESQIHNAFLDGDRSRPEDCGTGGIFRRQDARRVVADDLTWFHKTIIVSGPHMAVWVNGYQVSDWTDTRDEHPNPRQGLRLDPGTIMIQGHDPTTDLSFRNLRAGEMPPRRELDCLTSTPASLSGW